MSYEVATDGCAIRVMTDLEAVCELVRQRGWSTGHTEDVMQLMIHVLAQADERIAQLEDEVSRLRQNG